MEEKNISKKNTQIYSIIASLGLLFSCIFMVRAFSEGKVYDALEGNIPTNTQSVVGQKIISIESTLKADEAVKKQEYEQALQFISGNTSNDYYNRGTIQTLLAYEKALQNSVSGLESAQNFIAQAQQNFDLAQKLSSSKTMTKAIVDNQRTVTSLTTVIDIKSCYGLGQSIIININDISRIIKEIQDTLDQEAISIDKAKLRLDSACYERLHNIIDTSKSQAGLLQLHIKKDADKYSSDFSNKIENPMICIQTPYKNILPAITKGKAGLEIYQEQHQNTIEALKSNNKKIISALCDQSKNDAQINQEIQDSVQDLLQKLEDNTTKNLEQKKATDKVEYKDFFNENEKKVLQEIQQTNQGWIDTLLDTKGKGNYNPEKYIDEMFNKFYGNSGDFIDLHE